MADRLAVTVVRSAEVEHGLANVEGCFAYAAHRIVELVLRLVRSPYRIGRLVL